MKHRWSPTRYHRHAEQRLQQVRHCVKCGGTAMDISVIVDKKSLPYPRAVYFAPLAGTWTRVWPVAKYAIKAGMPKCEGLPANYEAPIGA